MAHDDRTRSDEAEVLPTLEQVLRGLVEGLNAELRGDEDPGSVPQLDAGAVIQAIFAATKGGSDRLSLEIDADVFDQMTDAIVGWVSAKHGIAFAIASAPEDDVDLDDLGQTILNAVIADQDMDQTPRDHLRTPEVVQRLHGLLVVIAEASLRMDEVYDKEEEEAYWEQAMGSIMANASMRKTIITALQAQENQETFLKALRPKLVKLEGGVRIQSLRRAIDAVEHESLMKAEGGSGWNKRHTGSA